MPVEPRGLQASRMFRDTFAIFNGGLSRVNKTDTSTVTGETCLKSRVKENFKHGSVRGLVASSDRCGYQLYSTAPSSLQKFLATNLIKIQFSDKMKLNFDYEPTKTHENRKKSF